MRCRVLAALATVAAAAWACGGGGGHSNTQSSRVVHVGLGAEASIDSVSVRWVGGAAEPIAGLEPDVRYRVVEGSGRGVPVP